METSRCMIWRTFRNWCRCRLWVISKCEHTLNKTRDCRERNCPAWKRFRTEAGESLRERVAKLELEAEVERYKKALRELMDVKPPQGKRSFHSYGMDLYEMLCGIDLDALKGGD